MAERTFYNEVLTDHNLHPDNKYQLKDPNKVKEGVNPSCGDEITIDYGQVEDVKPDEANQAKFVITVAAIGMAAHILDEKEKAEKTEKEQTEA